MYIYTILFNAFNFIYLSMLIDVFHACIYVGMNYFLIYLSGLKRMKVKSVPSHPTRTCKQK